MLNLNELNAFLTAAETGSYSAAGRKLGLSQPAISQSISSLERHLGVALFVRVGRSVRLTDAGLALKPLARELLCSSRRLEDQIACLNGEIQGDIRLVSSTGTGETLLPELIARFRQKFPQVSFSLHLVSEPELASSLLEGQADFGLMVDPHDGMGLEFLPVLCDPIILVVPRGHPWSGRPCLSPHQLYESGISLVLPEADSGLLAQLQAGLLSCGLSACTLVPALRASGPAALRAVEAGLGPAFVSRLEAAPSLAHGQVVAVEIEGLKLHQSVSLARYKRLMPGCAQAEFWSFAGQFSWKGA